QLLAGAVLEIEQTTGKSWQTDLETREHVREAVDLMLLVFSRGVETHPFPMAAVLGSPHRGLGRSAVRRTIKGAPAVQRLAQAFSGALPDPPGAKLASSGPREQQPPAPKPRLLLLHPRTRSRGG